MFSLNYAGCVVASALIMGCSSVGVANVESHEYVGASRASFSEQGKVDGAGNVVLILLSSPQSDIRSVHVHVNGQYHASLFSGSWTGFQVCSGEVNLTFSQDVDILRAPLQVGMHSIRAIPGQTLYFGLEPDQPVRLRPLSALEALKLLEQRKESRHALSRLKPEACIVKKGAASLPASKR